MDYEHAIILFIYNRPDHTKKVLEGLRQNGISKLYVFSDGPKTEKDIQLVEETRELIKRIGWCEVEADFSTKNKGLANSVIYGVTKVFSKGYGSVIVLEDDCVPTKHYIEYMKNTLDYYKSNPEVMHVSGFGLPIKKYTKADVYFTPFPCSWGWGTWADAWGRCDFNDITQYQNLLNQKNEIKDFNYSGEGFSAILQMQLDNKVSSWLIRWYYYIYSNNGRCVWCYDSLIENKGFDGTGNHKMKFDRFNQKRKIKSKIGPIYTLEDNLEFHPELIREFRRYFIDKSFKERIKTVIYLFTGIILETSRVSKVVQ